MKKFEVRVKVVLYQVQGKCVRTIGLMIKSDINTSGKEECKKEAEEDE